MAEPEPAGAAGGAAKKRIKCAPPPIAPRTPHRRAPPCGLPLMCTAIWLAPPPSAAPANAR